MWDKIKQVGEWIWQSNPKFIEGLATAVSGTLALIVLYFVLHFLFWVISGHVLFLALTAFVVAIVWWLVVMLREEVEVGGDVTLAPPFDKKKIKKLNWWWQERPWKDWE